MVKSKEPLDLFDHTQGIKTPRVIDITERMNVHSHITVEEVLKGSFEEARNGDEWEISVTIKPPMGTNKPKFGVVSVISAEMAAKSGMMPWKWLEFLFENARQRLTADLKEYLSD